MSGFSKHATAGHVGTQRPARALVKDLQVPPNKVLKALKQVFGIGDLSTFLSI